MESIKYIEDRLMEVLERTEEGRNMTVQYSTNELVMAKRVISNYQESMSLIRDYINDAMDTLAAMKRREPANP
jgi:hypothetical protein